MAKVKARVGNLERGGANQVRCQCHPLNSETQKNLPHSHLLAQFTVSRYYGSYGGIEIVPSLNHVWWFQILQASLSLAQNMGMVIVESDSADAIQLILDGRYVTPSILIHISEWRTRPWALTFTHIKRDGNRVVDSLAKMTTKSSFEMLYHVDLPSEMLDLLHEDMVVS
ncbi:hypothetical protein V6N11_075331 [Hibiscus sabdariffa]|uniref:RNase H type-1 domain-containing protein n=1 Tax=Hibiscus sabdariffa TaxID=183260 RepID=A0ABR2R6P8_9ROSI